MLLIIGLRRSASSGSIRLKVCDHMKFAALAHAAAHDLDGRHAPPELDEGFFEHGVRRWQWRLRERLPAPIESVVFITRAVKSVVTNAHEAAREHV